MKPLEAAAELRTVADLIARGEPLPPVQRGWLVRAIWRRLEQPDASLDRLLGLRSRAGGPLRVGSKLPARDQALQALAAQLAGTVAERARCLSARLRAHRDGVTDPELDELLSRFGRLPTSVAQLDRIIRGNTAASHQTA